MGKIVKFKKETFTLFLFSRGFNCLIFIYLSKINYDYSDSTDTFYNLFLKIILESILTEILMKCNQLFNKKK